MPGHELYADYCMLGGNGRRARKMSLLSHENLSDRIDPLVSVQIRFTIPLLDTVHPVFRYHRIAG
jgi:hypothetical protein